MASVLVTFGPLGHGVADLGPEALLDHFDALPAAGAAGFWIDETARRPQDFAHETGLQGNFTQQEPIPEAGIAAALDVLRGGRLHRYNVPPGEAGEVALLERRVRRLHRGALRAGRGLGRARDACALRALGVGPGDKVLSNGFTLAPVPGAIASVGRSRSSSR